MADRRYRVVIEGEFGERLTGAFEGLDVRAVGGRTEITGVLDRAQLSGLLRRVDDLGLTLLSVNPASSTQTRPANHQGERPRKGGTPGP